jgi:hypothetical protein
MTTVSYRRRAVESPGCLLLMLLADLAAPPSCRAAQQDAAMLAAQAVLAGTINDPIPGIGSRTEVRVLHPVLMGRWSMPGGWLRLAGTFNLEGWVTPGGEMTLGAWGEGFVDRRHPHTYVHELLAVAALPPHDGGATASLTVGKGFAPFGTDDPMMRPVLKYPVNHHLSQILERAVAIAAVRVGPAAVEAGLFNGDEPERPGQWPAIRRFGDSWAIRSTLYPWPGFETQLSRASVASPEHRPGAGLRQTKWSASVRWERGSPTTRAYALAEWARTSEADDQFVFTSVLAETAVRLRAHQAYARFERTERPEETRTGDLFRTPRPHLENSILGTTRWTIYTAGYGVTLAGPIPGLQLTPFAEGSHGRASERGSGFFDIEGLYGRVTFWSASAGVRVSWRTAGHRMGRYGAAMAPADRHLH